MSEKLNDKELKDLITKTSVQPMEVYIHNKTKKPYMVMALVLDEKTVSPLVVYNSTAGVHWARPLTEFKKNFSIGTKQDFFNSISKELEG